jgi:type I restriction enzyme, S subunit
VSAYPEYRDSGLPWLGPIPAHWEVRRNGRLFAERREAADPELPLLEVSIRTGVRVRQLGDGGRKQAMADRSKYQRARTGDIAYNMMRMWQGAVGVAPTDGLVSPAYVVARPYEDVEPRYYAYLFRTAAYLQQAAIESRGIVPDRNRLYWDAFKAMPSVYPPRDEQRAITDYLDQLSDLVRRFSASKRKVRAAIDRQMEAEFQVALTTGLCPQVERQTTTVPWLQAVPATWRVDKLKRFVTFNPSRSESGVHRDDEREVVFLPMERVSTDGTVDDAELRSIRDVAEGYTYFRRGDVILAKITPCFENGKGACLTELATEFGFGSSEFIVMRPRPGLTSEYLDLMLRMPLFRQLGEEAMTGAAGQQRISMSFLENFTVAVPPLDEQQQIVGAMWQRRETLRVMHDRVASELSLIQEYQKAAIEDAVMGRVDVRGRLVTTPGSDLVLPDDDLDDTMWGEEMVETNAVSDDAD